MPSGQGCWEIRLTKTGRGELDGSNKLMGATALGGEIMFDADATASRVITAKPSQKSSDDPERNYAWAYSGVRTAGTISNTRLGLTSFRTFELRP